MPTFVLDFFHCFHGLLCVSVHRFRRLPACIFSLTSDFLQIPPHDGHPCLRLTLSTAEGVVVFHHLVVAHAGRTRVTTNALRWTVCSGYNVPAPAICCVPVLPLRRRLPRGGISRSPLRLPWQPRILRLQYQNRWHRNAENHYHQAYTEGFAVFIFVSSRQTHGKYRSLIILLPSS